jgi:hypothetical protein
MSRPDQPPIYELNEYGEPRQVNAPSEERYTDVQQVFPELAARLIARAGFQNDVLNSKYDADQDFVFVLRAPDQEEYGQGLDGVVRVEPRYPR